MSRWAEEKALEKAIERVEAWLDRDEWGEAEFVRSAVIDALRGESNG